MLFSVIIPLYNKAPYIGAAIDSVLRQTCQDFEIIVVDDGSRDDGAAVVAAMPDPRIRLLRQPNGGVARARNAGIAAANGELICFLDADDWYGSGYLATIAAMARQYPRGAFYAAGFQRVVDGSSARLEGETAPAAPATLLTNFFAYRHRHGFFFCTNSVVVPRVALQAAQPCFPVGDQFGEDQDLWFRLAEQLQLVFCPSQLVAYRVGVADSLCARHNLGSVPPVFERLEQRVLAGALAPPMRQPALRIVSDARVAVARYALAAGRRRDALAQLRLAARARCTRKWCLTVIMCLFANGAMVRKWELWREKRLHG